MKTMRMFSVPVSLLWLVLFMLGVTATESAAGSRFMVLINEKNIGTYSMGEAERVVTEALMAKGADVVDSEMVRTTVNRDKALQAMTGGSRAAAALGLQFGADIIIVGKAVAKGSADRISGTSFRSYSATVTLKAVMADTAQIIASDMETAARIHVDDVVGGSEATKQAAQALADRLIPVILGKTGGGGRGHTIKLIIGDVTEVWQVAAIKKLLRKNIKGVGDVVQQSFVSGVARFDVDYRSDSQKLAEELTMADPGYFRIKVFGVTANKLDARLVDGGS